MKCQVIRFEEWEGGQDKGSVTPSIVEKGINNWLAQHRPARVSHIAQSEAAVYLPGGGGAAGTVARSLTVTLWYEE